MEIPALVSLAWIFFNLHTIRRKNVYVKDTLIQKVAVQDVISSKTFVFLQVIKLFESGNQKDMMSQILQNKNFFKI